MKRTQAIELREQQEKKHREVVATLSAHGFSSERAEEIWTWLDGTKELEALIADAVFWAAQENSEAIYGETGPNGEPPPGSFSHSIEADFDVPSHQSFSPFSSDTVNTGIPSVGGLGKIEANFDVPLDKSSFSLFEDDPLEESEEEDAEEEKEAAIETEKSNEQFLNALPPLLRELCTEIMRFLNIPALLPAVCILLAVSAALLRGLCCRSNKGITYANLFALLSADASAGKSLTYNAAMGPLEELDAELLAAFRESKNDMEAQLGLIKDELTALHANYAKAKKAEETLTEKEKQTLRDRLKTLHKEQTELEKHLTQEPSLWALDFTAEALGVLLAHNREQMSVCNDEGSITLDNLLGRYNKGDATDDGLLRKSFTVNAYKVHRISRESISLKKPCVSLLLLVQEIILREAFANSRLVFGGFLARCFTAHCRLKMQEETEETEVPLSEEVLGRWRALIRELYFKFRCADSPCELKVDPAVRVLSRQQHNAIARMANGKLRNVRSFVGRWIEQTWKTAEVLHAGRYGAQCDEYSLSTDTFKAAQSISQLFCKEQLKVLGALQSEQLRKTHLRLQELFLDNSNEPMRLRNLERTHGLDQGEVKDCVRAYSKIYGLVRVKPPRGSRSTLVFLQAFPPQAAAP